MNNDETKALIADAVLEALPFPCDQCSRRFPKKQALVMHKMRVHTREGVWGAKKGVKANQAKFTNAPSHTREWKSAYNRRWRERKKAEQEAERKKWSSYKREKYQEMKARRAAQGLNARGQPFTEAGKKIIAGMQKSGFVKYVYPLPGDETAPPPAVSAAVKFCPFCGNDIQHLLTKGVSK